LTISCRLRVVLAQLNVERAKMGQPAMSLRRLSQESGVSLSVLAALHTGRSQRIDYATIDRLLIYFNRFLPINIDDLFRWEAVQEESVLSPAPAGLQPVQPGLG
jgi:DNA-binding Xre family transcriptional regulator